LPVLDLFITLGKSGFADSFTGAIAAIDEPGYDFTAGLRAEYPIGNRAARALDLRARTSRDQARIGLDNLAQLVSQDVRATHLEVDRARRQIDASAITRAAQEEVVRAELAKFEAGTSTAFFVAQAQRDLLEARIVETRAVVAYRLAVIDLYRLEGSLLERRGITGPGARPLHLAPGPPPGQPRAASTSPR
jgi:outer membrane protein